MKTVPMVQRIPKSDGPLSKFVTRSDSNSTEKMEKIANFFVKNGVARRIDDKPEFKEAFPRDIPANTTRSDLERAIDDVAKKSRAYVKQLLSGSMSSMEIDGGKKAGIDFTNIILEGCFVESFERN